MWKYDQSSGDLTHNGHFVSKGYSGKGRGKNNPSLQGVAGVGPIPAGKWKMVRIYDSASVGPKTIALEAVDAKPGDDKHEGTGRSAIRVHGDSIKAPGTASRGCIIMPRHVREKMWLSGDRDLLVVE